MTDFSIHPNVYQAGNFPGLRSMLEDVWVRDHTPGDGTFYVVSGFANYNGGARFYKSFKEHVEEGGRIVAFLGGSTSQRLSSKQVVEALLECGAEVNIINRKRLLHAKCYGVADSRGERLVVTSGNFTAPGISQNVEAALLLDRDEMQASQFLWQEAEDNLKAQSWQRHEPDLADRATPAWRLLYDETPGLGTLDETETVTMVLILGHADTARIQADSGTDAGKGSQYFWLSKDSFDFFPPLTIRNNRGYKGTLSCLIDLEYCDIDDNDTECRVTFEAENNVDFRLGTGRLRYSRIAAEGYMACITRVTENRYQLRILAPESAEFQALDQYAINFIGNRGKRYGYLDNDQFIALTGIDL
jgi:hypothetical protein